MCSGLGCRAAVCTSSELLKKSPYYTLKPLATRNAGTFMKECDRCVYVVIDLISVTLLSGRAWIVLHTPGTLREAQHCYAPIGRCCDRIFPSACYKLSMVGLILLSRLLRRRSEIDCLSVLMLSESIFIAPVTQTYLPDLPASSALLYSGFLTSFG